MWGPQGFKGEISNPDGQKDENPSTGNVSTMDQSMDSEFDGTPAFNNSVYSNDT